MDVNEFSALMKEYALDSEQYKGWREIHTKTFGKVFSLAFEDSREAALQLTAALIRISKRDFNSGFSMLKPLEDFCTREIDDFALNYFMGLCCEFIGDEE